MRVLAFARLRELLGWQNREASLAEGADAAELWSQLAREHPLLGPLAESTRIARNGRIVSFAEPIADGDEIALLPPAGGG